jgi:hypothetical protein
MREYVSGSSEKLKLKEAKAAIRVKLTCMEVEESRFHPGIPSPILCILSYSIASEICRLRVFRRNLVPSELQEKHIHLFENTS